MIHVPYKVPSQRQKRVNETVHHALSSILMQCDGFDPLPFAASITVTEVQINADLQHARVYVSPLLLGAARSIAGEEQKAFMDWITAHAPRIRWQLGKKVVLRYLPELAFQYDTRFERAAHIDRLLHE